MPTSTSTGHALYLVWNWFRFTLKLMWFTTTNTWFTRLLFELLYMVHCPHPNQSQSHAFNTTTSPYLYITLPLWTLSSTLPSSPETSRSHTSTSVPLTYSPFSPPEFRFAFSVTPIPLWSRPPLSSTTVLGLSSLLRNHYHILKMLSLQLQHARFPLQSVQTGDKPLIFWVSCLGVQSGRGQGKGGDVGNIEHFHNKIL